MHAASRGAEKRPRLHSPVGRLMRDRHPLLRSVGFEVLDAVEGLQRHLPEVPLGDLAVARPEVGAAASGRPRVRDCSRHRSQAPLDRARAQGAAWARPQPLAPAKSRCARRHQQPMHAARMSRCQSERERASEAEARLTPLPEPVPRGIISRDRCKLENDAWRN